ncbi:MAG: SWIM zinc finger family protein [Candidatus Competibacteraceae bacterium]|nr:SWIM zinc finger family protein [Candidatus Competibacteraceae bacterium]
MQLSVQEVLKLSPDDSSAKAAKSLVMPGKWPRLHQDDRAVWGECQGSGSKPYQVQVDQTGPTFRCSCPSRKFPCKHGLALLLLRAQHPDCFSVAEQPTWVSEWLESRRKRVEKQTAKAAETALEGESAAKSTPDPVATVRRESARLDQMRAGLAELERWLGDRLRQGLARLPNQPELWNELATRMVDAKLPGIAYRLHRIGGWVNRGEQWPARVLGGLGQLYILVDAFRRLSALPAPVQADLHNALGVTVERETVLNTGERIKDDWLVLGQRIEEESRLWSRRVWLWGITSHRTALLLDHAHGIRRFNQNYVTSVCVGLTLAFFPGNAPLRALVIDEARVGNRRSPVNPPTLDESLNTLANALAANPWQWPQPFLFGNGIPCRNGNGWGLQTPFDHRLLPLTVSDDNGWLLLAESGGEPLTVFGEWDGETLHPLSAWATDLFWTPEAAPA